MSERNTVLRCVHGLGLAAWFGGSLMGAVGLNGAARGGRYTADEASRIAMEGWAKWAPVNAVAIGAHLLGGAGLPAADVVRVRGRRGGAAAALVEIVLTGAALTATTYSWVLGSKLAVSTSDGAEDLDYAVNHPVDVENARSQLKVMQWTLPALTGAIVVLNALRGERRRSVQQAAGVLQTTACRVPVSRFADSRAW
ncbi:hypothetical protein ACFWBV_32090 [Streptomyces sp. NPDC060030]|uniref:hypothetical protein n=1 Tax=Streptomyces sp. NPDC060030 TaxID=3347042 RepID=UPI0036C467E1